MQTDITTDVAAGILPASELGFQPGGTDGETDPTEFWSRKSGGKMPSSLAGGTPAATVTLKF